MIYSIKKTDFKITYRTNSVSAQSFQIAACSQSSFELTLWKETAVSEPLDISETQTRCHIGGVPL